MSSARCLTAAGALAALTLFGAGAACAQHYPSKPIRMLTAEPGGGLDFVARIIAQGLTNSLGQQIIVDNRPAGPILGETAARAAPDGYTLLVTGSSFWIAPFLQKQPYDLKQFSPVTLAVKAPSVLAVHPSVAAKSVNELIALARARPGVLNYGSGAAGTPAHLTAELFKSMTGINIVQILYKGAGPAINAAIAGEVQIVFGNAAGVIAHLKSGRLRGLAVTSAEPSALVPDLPTIASAGLRGYDAVAYYGMFAPAKTPDAIIRRLSQESTRILRTPDAKEKLLNSGVETIGGTPEEFAATVKSEMAVWGKLIRDAGIRAE